MTDATKTKCQLSDEHLAARTGTWSKQTLRVLKGVSAFREARQVLDASIRDVYPIGRRVRATNSAGDKYFGTVAHYVMPLDEGLVMRVEKEDYDRCPTFMRAGGKNSDGLIVLPWSYIEGPTYEAEPRT